MTIAEGERVALLGPSGAGKSTLLRALLGAVPATGRVRIGGSDPYGSRREATRIRCGTGVVRQGNDLVLGVSSRLNALMGTAATWHVRDWLRALTGRTPAPYQHRLETLAAQHGVLGCLGQQARQLSGGQRQRVALVRALLGQPLLLLADEPTSGLDPVTAAVAVDALRTAGSTVVVATHDLAVARQFSRILALRDGRLAYDGATLDESIATSIYHHTDRP